MQKFLERFYSPVRWAEIPPFKIGWTSKFIMSFWNKWVNFCFVGNTCTINEVIDLNLEALVNKPQLEPMPKLRVNATSPGRRNTQVYLLSLIVSAPAFRRVWKALFTQQFTGSVGGWPWQDSRCPPTLLYHSSAGWGGENTTRGSWVKIKAGRNHSPITITSKTDLAWGNLFKTNQLRVLRNKTNS